MTIGSRQRITVTHDNMAIKLDGSEINKVETVNRQTPFMVSSY